MESRGGVSRLWGGFLSIYAGALGGVPVEGMAGAVITLAFGLILRGARAMFHEGADARAHKAIQDSLRGDFAAFELRLMERLDKEFTRTPILEQRFAAIDESIARERAARVELQQDVRELRCGGRA